MVPLGSLSLNFAACLCKQLSTCHQLCEQRPVARWQSPTLRGPGDKTSRWRQARKVVPPCCVLTALAKLKAEGKVVVRAEPPKICTAHRLEAKTERWRGQASARLFLLSAALLAGRKRLSSLFVIRSDTDFLLSTDVCCSGKGSDGGSGDGQVQSGDKGDA